MKKALIILAIAAVLIFAGVLFFFRSSGPSQASTLAPADAVFFINVPNIPLTGLRWHRTALAQIAAEPEVKAFLELPMKSLMEAPATGEAGDVLIGLKPGNIFAAVTSASPTDTNILVGFQFWGSKKDYDNAVARLRQELPVSTDEQSIEEHRGIEILTTKHGEISFYSAAAGRWGLLSTNVQMLKDAIDRATRNPSAPALSTNERFLKVAAHLLAEPDLLVFIQPEKAIDTLLAAGQSLGAEAIPGHVENLKSTEALGATLKLDGFMQRDAVFVLRPGSASSLPKLTHAPMRLTSKDTALFFDFILDFESLPAWVANLESTYPRVSATLAPLAKDIAATYGPECAIIADWSSENMVPSPLVAVQVKDAERAGRFLSPAMQLIPGATSLDMGTSTVYAIPAQFVSIAAVQSPEFLVFGTDANAVVAATSVKAADALLDKSKAFQSALPDYRSANEAFCYIDSRTVFERLYNSLVPVIRFGAAMMPDVTRHVDVSKLPRAETIGKHLPPIVLSQKRTSEGTLVESSGPVSMSQFLILSAAGAAASNQSFFSR
jgi:hypothetical protein